MRRWSGFRRFNLLARLCFGCSTSLFRKGIGPLPLALHCVGPYARRRGSLVVLDSQGSPANSLRSNMRDRRASARP